MATYNIQQRGKIIERIYSSERFIISTQKIIAIILITENVNLISENTIVTKGNVLFTAENHIFDDEAI